LILYNIVKREPVSSPRNLKKDKKLHDNRLFNIMKYNILNMSKR